MTPPAPKHRMTTGLAPARHLITLVACAGLLGGCGTMLPAGVLPDWLGGPSISPDGPLPPPVAREHWSDPAVDVLNQRAGRTEVVPIPRLERYLTGLLNQIKQAAQVPDWPGAVYLTASPGLSAYATTAGNVYLSLSWINQAESEDAIVALLAHEYAHVYLHYHQIAQARQQANTLVQNAHMAVTLLRKLTDTPAETGWTSLDTLQASYTIGSELVSSVWARNHETAADLWSMNISRKLGYSYEAGTKALLEHILSQEAARAEEQAKLTHRLLAHVRAQLKQTLADQARATTGRHLSSLPVPTAPLSTVLTAAQTVIIQELDETLVQEMLDRLATVWEGAREQHPQIQARIDLLATLDMETASGHDPAPRTEPWRKVVEHPEVQRIATHYALAFQAVRDLTAPDALTNARRAVQGPTQAHSLPGQVLYLATAAQATKTTPKDMLHYSNALQPNLAQPTLQSWTNISTRSQLLHAAGKPKEATALMTRGFTYFEQAENVWPGMIEFTGETTSWPEAKALAGICRQRFPLIAQDCANAAASPNERQQQDASLIDQAKIMIGKWLGR